MRSSPPHSLRPATGERKGAGDVYAWRVPPALAVFVDQCPELSETFVRPSSRRCGGRARRARAGRRRAGTARPGQDDAAAAVFYRGDDGAAARSRALLWLVARAPRARRPRPRAPPALAARGVGAPLRALAGVARRVFQAGRRAPARALRRGRGARRDAAGRPARAALQRHRARLRHLRPRPATCAEKLEARGVVFTGCDYNVDYLRRTGCRARPSGARGRHGRRRGALSRARARCPAGARCSRSAGSSRRRASACWSRPPRIAARARAVDRS